MRHGYARRGQKKSKTYESWQGMKARCLRPTHQDYPHYGGRGIQVCKLWQDDFVAFLEDMGECPEGMSLERINVDGHYERSNCRWASQYEQVRNTRRNVLLEYQGEIYCLVDLAEKLGLQRQTLRARIKAGWPEERWDELPEGPRRPKMIAQAVELKSKGLFNYQIAEIMGVSSSTVARYLADSKCS